MTVGRSDYGIYLPVLEALRDRGDINLEIIASGTHLLPQFGFTLDRILADGFSVSERVEMLLAGDTPESVAKSMALGALGFSQAFARNRPDILLVLGDRFEMHAAALSALPFRIPVAHIHGGELTFGAMDDALRHSITKLSHLHFVSLPEYGRRIERMGEEPWRITVSGAPSLDVLNRFTPLSEGLFFERFKLAPVRDFLLVTHHPVTLSDDFGQSEMEELLAALDAAQRPVLFTMPNADSGNLGIRAQITRYAASRGFAQITESLGLEGYATAMSLAGAMVGNSSSGIIEAASFALPVVNIGERQAGRVRGVNVVDVAPRRALILEAIQRVASPGFRASLKGAGNLYGTGHAAPKIAERLASVEINLRLLTKNFYDTE